MAEKRRNDLGDNPIKCESDDLTMVSYNNVIVKVENTLDEIVSDVTPDALQSVKIEAGEPSGENAWNSVYIKTEICDGEARENTEPVNVETGECRPQDFGFCTIKIEREESSDDAEQSLDATAMCSAELKVEEIDLGCETIGSGTDVDPTPAQGPARKRRKHNNGDKTIKCDFCNKIFSSPFHWKLHTAMHAIDKPFKCDVCYKSFTLSNSLRVHSYIHTVKSTYKCVECDEKFPEKKLLLQHISNKCNKPKVYKCDACGKQFSETTALEYHMCIKAGGPKPEFKCKACGKVYDSQFNLKWHMRVHNYKEHVCELCDRKFYRLGNFTKHMAKHARQSQKATTK